MRSCMAVGVAIASESQCSDAKSARVMGSGKGAESRTDGTRQVFIFFIARRARVMVRKEHRKCLSAAGWREIISRRPVVRKIPLPVSSRPKKAEGKEEAG